ncbi:MAG: hypothetical protein HQL58_05405 [Magnetococcales bacterium]|nr:hypothetical protein [Magnetococcales bacterium]
MYQAIEAVCKNGTIFPIEPVSFDEEEPLVILRLSKQAVPSTTCRIRGAMKGLLSSVDEFIDAKREEIALEDLVHRFVHPFQPR